MTAIKVIKFSECKYKYCTNTVGIGDQIKYQTSYTAMDKIWNLCVNISFVIEYRSQNFSKSDLSIIGCAYVSIILGALNILQMFSLYLRLSGFIFFKEAICYVESGLIKYGLTS